MAFVCLCKIKKINHTIQDVDSYIYMIGTFLSSSNLLFKSNIFLMFTLFDAFQVILVQYRTIYIVLDIKKRPSYESRFLISKFLFTWCHIKHLFFSMSSCLHFSCPLATVLSYKRYPLLGDMHYATRKAPSFLWASLAFLYFNLMPL